MRNLKAIICLKFLNNGDVNASDSKYSFKNLIVNELNNVCQSHLNIPTKLGQCGLYHNQGNEDFVI